MKKRRFLLLLALIVLALPVSATTTLFNFGFNIHNDFWGMNDLHLRSIGLSVSHLNGDQTGFYLQANPYFGLSFKSTSVAKLSDHDETLIGSNFLLGYGGDFNFGSMGLLVGGGLFLDAFNYNFGNSAFTMSVGAGLGANFYFQPGSGNLIINAGLSAAISPWSIVFSDGDSSDYTNWGQSTVNFNVGVGWRTGGSSRSSKDTGGSSSGGGDDDW